METADSNGPHDSFVKNLDLFFASITTRTSSTLGRENFSKRLEIDVFGPLVFHLGIHRDVNRNQHRRRAELYSLLFYMYENPRVLKRENRYDETWNIRYADVKIVYTLFLHRWME